MTKVYVLLLLVLVAACATTPETVQMASCILTAGLTESLAAYINTRWQPGTAWQPLAEAFMQSAGVVWSSECFPRGLGALSLQLADPVLPTEATIQLINELDRIGADPALVADVRGDFL